MGERRTTPDRRAAPRAGPERRGQLSPPCINCGSTDSYVVDSRLKDDLKRRHRRCGACGKTFITEERSIRLSISRVLRRLLPKPTTY